MRISNLICRHNVRPERTECINALAEAEYARLHLPTLNIARRDIVENYVATDVVACLRRVKMARSFFQNDRQFEFIVEFLREGRRESPWFPINDDWSHV